MNRPGRYTVILLGLLACLPAMSAEQRLEVIPLQHRLVEDVIPVLQPLVEPGGSITGMNNQLVIKASPSNIAELQQVLASIDRPPRRLMITVRQDVSGSEMLREQGISGRYSQGDITVRADQVDRIRDGASVGVEDDDGNRLRYHIQNQTGSREDRNTFRVQATEGYPAYIQAGQSLPVQERSTYIGHGGVIVQDGIHYHDATSGFYVLPRVQGNTVTLQIAPHLTTVQRGHQPPVVRMQDVQTTVSGRLGEWIAIGGVDQTGNHSQQRILGGSSSHSSEQGTILLKVEELQ
jgi:type II secretory pathway component HofQ